MGTLEIEACCVSMLGGIQPGPLGQYLRDAVKGGAGDDGFMQRFQLAVALAFEDTEDRRFAARTSAASPPNPLGAEVRLIDFDLAAERAGFFAGLGHTDMQRTQQPVQGVAVEAGELRDLCGVQISGDVSQELAKGGLGDP